MKISELLPDAARALAESGVPEHVREASSLLRFALDRDRVFLISYPDYRLSSEEQARFWDVLRRRAGREPLQYITGVQEFYGLEFRVTPDVLIPRPETEMLAAKAIELMGGSPDGEFAEIGIGSGCISIAVLANLPAVRGLGVDISAAAIDVAKGNAERHNVASRLALVESDLFANFPDRRFGLIVSNPPYVPCADMAGLQPEVRAFEPGIALTDGADGLSIVNRIISESPRHLLPAGYLLLEIGFDQAPAVAAAFDRAIWGDVEILPDFQGIPRMAAARLKRRN